MYAALPLSALQVRVTALAKCDDGAETAVSVYLYCDERGQLSGDWCYEAWRNVHLDSFAASCREWASVRCPFETDDSSYRLTCRLIWHP